MYLWVKDYSEWKYYKCIKKMKILIKFLTNGTAIVGTIIQLNGIDGLNLYLSFYSHLILVYHLFKYST